MAGRLELIMGCMFSGKSTELIKRIREHKLLDRHVLCITHVSDTRYGVNKIVSHTKENVDATGLEKLKDIEPNVLPLYDVICIEEAHFFKDLKEFVIPIVEILGKIVIVCGLDGTFQRQPFTNVIELIPLADDVVKLKALCLFCKDGTRAPFSKRLVSNTNTLLVGGSDMYASVCRYHYNNNLKTC